MGRSPQAVADDGLVACSREDGARVVTLLAELTAALDFGHPAASAVCRFYEEARAGAAADRFDAARALFQALRGV